MGGRDIRYEFADFAVYPSRLCFYFLTTMVNNINNFGVINFYENPYSSSKKEQAKCEDVTPVETSETLFCRITQVAYDKGKAQQVEDELQSACVSAPKLVKAIRTNEALGYLDTQNLSSVELYNLLNEHFGLTFRVRTFQDYRSK